MANLRKTGKRTVLGMSRTAMLKRKLYKAAIKGLITLAFMIPTYIWFIDRTTDVINKRIEKYQSPSSNKDTSLSIESEKGIIVKEDLKQQKIEIINQRKQESITNARREAEIRKVVETEQKLERFKAQYKKPEKCYNVTDNETRVFCANDYIRARKAFELKQANLANQ